MKKKIKLNVTLTTDFFFDRDNQEVFIDCPNLLDVEDELNKQIQEEIESKIKKKLIPIHEVLYNHNNISIHSCYEVKK